MPLLNYGEAIEFAKIGFRIARYDWKDNVFVFQRPSDRLAKGFLPNFKSLPNSTKEFLIALKTDIAFNSYLCLKDESNNVVNGWTPTQEDMFANDWYSKD
jgi:hypothetical protein